MRHRLTSAALALTIGAMACSDSPTATTALRPFEGILQHTVLEDFIQAAIDRYLPRGFESAVEARWANVQRKKNSGDMAGAIGEFNRLSLWIDKKTPDITIPSNETATKDQAAALIIVNMGRWLYEGAAADPLVVPTGDVAVEVVPAGAPLEMVVPSLHASVRWDAGATQEERVVVLLQDAQPYPAQCQGPLATRRCQYPLFYKVESFPHIRLQLPGRIAVCMVTDGPRRPIEYPSDEPITHGSHGPVGERLRLAHNLPANPADRHPQGIIEDGIEILPLSETQSGLTDCDAHSHASLSPVQKALHSVMHLAGKIVAPKNAYAFDLGPEHEFSFFSNFNAVDPFSAPDVTVTGLTGAATADPAATVDVSYRVANRSRRSAAGAATATSGPSEVMLFLSNDAELDSGDQLVEGSQQVFGPLAPGDSSGVVTFGVPMPEVAGTYYVIASVLQEEGSLDECEPSTDPEFPTCWIGNNTAAHQVTVTSPDVGSVLFGVESGTDGLSIINPLTGASTFVARLNPDQSRWTTPIALTTDPSTGTVYAWNNSGSENDDGVLLSINVCTGLATQVSVEASGITAGALAASASGQLYLLGQNGTLYGVNKANGALTAIGATGLNAFGADIDPATGVLYAVVPGQETTTLHTVNLQTGQATLVANLSVNVGIPGSIVFTPSGTLMGSAFGLSDRLFDIDTATGAVSNVRLMGLGTAPQGMAFAAGCAGPFIK